MQTVHVDLADAPYDILIGRGLLDDASSLARLMPFPRAVVVSNTTIAPLYLDRLRNALGRAGIDSFSVVLPDGEQQKNWTTLNCIFDALLHNRCERKTTLLALGGGVIGDMTGFAAAVYQRGVPFIQIPTTLLAQVDSSVGGKTAINHPLGKNMIGAFHQPTLVLADLDTLSTLPAREFSAGLAEVIKYGLIDDIGFFEWLEANMAALMRRDMDALLYAVEHSCRNKARIVAADERETGVRALLNLGHTFGHAVETGLGYGSVLHGEAVAIGIVLSAHASRLNGDLTDGDVERITQLLASAGLSVTAPRFGLQEWLSLMSHDKKVEGGKLRFILMRQLGQSYVGELDATTLERILT